LGLASPLATLRAGTTLALANKESLIVGGRFVTDIASAGDIVPVDSEHSAIAQALRSGSRGEVAQLVITATGGPFRGRHRGELSEVTVGEAMAHPTWSMGQVITINSSTLINKGLEVIEAHHLFGMPFDKIAVIGHPQSCIHSMVDFVDGSTIAQVSPPDMRLAISLGLGWPDRVPGAATRFDWSQPQRGTYSHSTTRPFRRCNWPTKLAGPVAAARGLQRSQRGLRPGFPRASIVLAGHRGHRRASGRRPRGPRRGNARGRPSSRQLGANAIARTHHLRQAPLALH